MGTVIHKLQESNVCRFEEIINGSDGVIQSAIVQNNDKGYKRPAKRMPLNNQDEMVFLMANRAGDAEATLEV